MAGTNGNPPDGVVGAAVAIPPGAGAGADDMLGALVVPVAGGGLGVDGFSDLVGEQEQRAMAARAEVPTISMREVFILFL